MNNVTNSFCTNLLLDATNAYRLCVDNHCRASETLIALLLAPSISSSASALGEAQVALEAASRALTRSRFLLDSTVAMFDTLATDRPDDAAIRLTASLERLAEHNPARR
jgi:hypothetical protein